MMGIVKDYDVRYNIGTIIDRTVQKRYKERGTLNGLYDVPNNGKNACRRNY